MPRLGTITERNLTRADAAALANSRRRPSNPLRGILRRSTLTLRDGERTRCHARSDRVEGADDDQLVNVAAVRVRMYAAIARSTRYMPTLHRGPIMSGIGVDDLAATALLLFAKKQGWWAANAQLITSIVGIVVSGVVGPQITVWATRRWDRRKFERDQRASRRDHLRVLLDQAAMLLGTGRTNLRLLREAASANAAAAEDAQAWHSQVFPLGQRLRLYLAGDDPIIHAYEVVRERLIEAASSPVEDEETLRTFETARDAFLDEARTRLTASIDEGR